MTILDAIILEHIKLHPATEADLIERTGTSWIEPNLRYLTRHNYIKLINNHYHLQNQFEHTKLCLVVNGEPGIYKATLNELGYSQRMPTGDLQSDIEAVDAVLIHQVDDKAKRAVKLAEKQGKTVIYV
jgi:hypothetical protein